MSAPAATPPPDGLEAASAAALGPHGELAARLEGFHPRSQQQEMGAAVARAFEARSVLVCEAGTGTGKTFAYLVPALLGGQRVVISTGTKSLQDQLFHRDLPRLRDALGVAVSARLLKGRASYLCRHRLTLHLAQPELLPGASGRDLQRIDAWARVTSSGDIAEAPGVPEDSPAWAYATSTRDNCLGQECPVFDDCHLVKARRAALEARVVVVNHHLFFADLALREEGFGELLPGADAVILDEAHQVPDVASRFFSTTVSARQLRELARDAVAAYQAEAGDLPELVDRARTLELAVARVHDAFGATPRRSAWHALAREPALAEAVAGLRESLGALGEALEILAERGRELRQCAARRVELETRLSEVTAGDPGSDLQWVEVLSRSFALHRTPMDIAPQFGAETRGRPCAWVFTSATLAVGDSFEHFARRLGLTGQEERRWDSPFDYGRQALGYVPPELPSPASPRYTQAVVDAVAPVLEASRGRAFFLFTSHRALQAAARALEGRLDYPLLVQGTLPKAQLLERFRTTPGAVLLGTASFWEGVDVPGEALSCVIIDKLPFAPPDDPLVQARDALRKEAGGNPFLEERLPEAVIVLKQGVGRLIRHLDDRGVLVLCDPRMLTRSYGRVFLQSLPPMPVTRSLEDVALFFDPAAASGPDAAPGIAPR